MCPPAHHGLEISNPFKSLLKSYSFEGNIFLSLLQKLPELTLRRLKLEQSKARHLPLHLHAHRLCLPLGQPLDFVCKPPLFFQKTLRKLELDIPKD